MRKQCMETNYFFQENHSPPPPLNIKWSVPSLLTAMVSLALPPMVSFDLQRRTGNE